MNSILNSIKISHRLWLIVGLAVMSLVIHSAIDSLQLRDHLFEEKKIQTQKLVESAHTVVTYFYEEARSGIITEQDAKTAARDALRFMRYGDKGYFWINDFTPRVVMHPNKLDIVGKDMSDSIDGNGKKHWLEFVDVVKQHGGGFVDYVFLHKVKGVVAPKIAYLKGFKPWGWIIGTGIYVDDVDDVFWNSVVESSVTLLFIVVLLSAVSFILAKSITKPLRQTIQLLKRLDSGQGDLLQGLKVNGNDELAELATVINQFIAKLRGLINALMKSSESLVNSTQNVNRIASASNEAAEHQKSESSQVVIAMTELYAAAGEVASVTSEASDAVARVNDMADKGLEVVKSNESAINGLNADMVQVEERMQELQKDSESIGSILDTIRSIADQTNLLALNAAIEAARAGEQGRGFAVVADEVRTLAQRTQDSTSEIEKMISSLQSGTVQAVNAVAGGRSKAESSVESTRQTGQMLVDIGEAVSEINELNLQIATAAEEQLAVVGTINDNVTRISDISDRNATGASDTLSAAESMSIKLNELMEVSSGFKLGKNDSEFDFSLARSAHLSWVNRVQAHLDGKSSLGEDELMSHHHCVLGKWYYGEGLSNYGHINAMVQLEKPHAHLHSTIKDCIDLKSRGDERGARRLLEDLTVTSEKIVNKLNQVEEQIAAEQVSK